LIAADIVVPGDLARSRLWQRIAVKGDMPFDNSPRIQGADLLALKNWIETLQRPTPQPRSQEQILDIVVLDQNGAANRNANLRYLSFAHFVDEHRSAAEMAAIEGVLNLVLNSLSRSATLYKVEAVNYDRSVFRVDLGRLGWNANLWNEIVSFYPYCLQSAKQTHRDLYTRLGTEAPVIRGDWFMATAVKAPLYNDLLDIKETLDEQAAVLGVDINANLQNGQNVIRMGFKSSGVSLHNRVIERHGRGNGAYLWVSYDFERDGIGDTNDILENPLGPKLRDRNNFAHDFVNAAGEIIFALPNGMQAFMLVNDAGQRIEVANTAIVADQRRRDGAVQNGVSCFGCHGITGMLRPRVFDEVIRNAETNKNKYTAQELDRIRRLYVRNGDAILATDAARYFKSVDALGTTRTLGGGIEYDTFIALIGEYEARLGLRGSALEIGVDALTLTNTVKGRPDLAVPVSAANPLILRDDFVCRYRRIVKTLRNVNFCAKTFSDASLETFCDNR
jgi:hypothetical protein